MIVRAGDVRQLTIAGREYDPAPGSSFNLFPGGMNNDFGLNGNGTGHVTQKRSAAGMTDLTLSIDDTRKDLEALQKVANDGVAVPTSVTLAGGVAYSGSLVLVGELSKGTGEGTAKVELRGERFEQI